MLSVEGLRGGPLTYPSPENQEELAFSKDPQFCGSLRSPWRPQASCIPAEPPRMSWGLLRIPPPKGYVFGTVQLAQASQSTLTFDPFPSSYCSSLVRLVLGLPFSSEGKILILTSSSTQKQTEVSIACHAWAPNVFSSLPSPQPCSSPHPALFIADPPGTTFLRHPTLQTLSLWTKPTCPLTAPGPAVPTAPAPRQPAASWAWRTPATARGSLARRRAPLSPGTPRAARAPKTYKLRLFQSLYGFICSDLGCPNNLRLREAPRGPSRSDLECQLSLQSPPCPDFRNVLWRVTCLVLALSWRVFWCIFSGHLLFPRGRGSQPRSPSRSSVTAGIVLRRWRKFAGGGRMWYSGTEKAVFVSYGTFRGAEETGPNSVWAVT